jgi:hypothetical protein
VGDDVCSTSEDAEPSLDGTPVSLDEVEGVSVSVPGEELVLPVGVTGGVTLELDVELLEDDWLGLGLLELELFEFEELLAVDVGTPVTGDGAEVLAEVVGVPDGSPTGSVDLSAEHEAPSNPPIARETWITEARG